MSNKFNCDKCGECCRHVNLIPELVEYDDGTGACKYLHNNLCSIYETRPNICNVDVMYEQVYSNYYTKDEFYEINEKCCKEIKTAYKASKTIKDKDVM